MKLVEKGKEKSKAIVFWREKKEAQSKIVYLEMAKLISKVHTLSSSFPGKGK